jgi:2-keto-3-deoxy-L-rhamnonate aldolase RhmA
MWITLQSTNLIELAAAHGLDAVILDQEHTTSGLDAVREQIVAAQLGGMMALVRPPSIDPHLVGRILDAGAEGIVFPRVSSVEDARTAAAAVRYPPGGTRGWAGSHARHVRWNSSLVGPNGEGVWSAEFVAAADDSVASVFMIAPTDKESYYPGCFFSAGVDATIASEAIRARMSEARSEVARRTGDATR